MSQTFTAAVLGASGLVGGQLLRQLAEDPAYTAVTALVRRPLGPDASHAKIRDAVVNFDDPASYGPHLAVDHVFCALGTTIKKAGSQEAFRKVDHDYPLAMAREAAARGAKRFIVVTAVDANPGSGIFYNRVKGELEIALRSVGFAEGVKVMRPSMLLGERGERRPAERVGAAVMRATSGLMLGGLRKYKPIEGADVARAMRRAATAEPAGDGVYEGAELFRLVAGG